MSCRMRNAPGNNGTIVVPVRTRDNFLFIISVDRIFTNLFVCLFTKLFDATAESR
jgi:hypothetical protein